MRAPKKNYAQTGDIEDHLNPILPPPKHPNRADGGGGGGGFGNNKPSKPTKAPKRSRGGMFGKKTQANKE